MYIHTQQYNSYPAQTNVISGYPQTTATISQEPRHQRSYFTSGAKRAVLGMAISQLVMGALCIIFEIALMAVYHRNQDTAKEPNNWINGYAVPGIWGGITFLVLGGIGCGAAKRNTNGFIVAYMVLNIIETSFIIPTFLGFTSAALDQSKCQFLWYWYSSCPTKSANIGLNTIILLMILAQFIITIVASAYCCGATCCHTTGTVVHNVPSQAVVVQHQTSFNQQYPQQYPHQYAQQYPQQYYPAGQPMAHQQYPQTHPPQNQYTGTQPVGASYQPPPTYDASASTHDDKPPSYSPQVKY